MSNQPLLYTTSAVAEDGYTEQVPALESKSIELLEVDPQRLFFILHNESGILYVRFGSDDVTKEDYTYRLTSNFTLENNFWRGRVTIIKEAGDSIVQLTVAKGVY